MSPHICVCAMLTANMHLHQITAHLHTHAHIGCNTNVQMQEISPHAYIPSNTLHAHTYTHIHTHTCRKQGTYTKNINTYRLAKNEAPRHAAHLSRRHSITMGQTRLAHTKKHRIRRQSLPDLRAHFGASALLAGAYTCVFVYVYACLVEISNMVYV